jgi:hypothetical protein
MIYLVKILFLTHLLPCPHTGILLAGPPIFHRKLNFELNYIQDENGREQARNN